MKLDGQNMTITWNVDLLESSYNNLFRYPHRKEVRYTDYAEYDGITADLRKFETKPRKVTLSFQIKHKSTDEFREKYQQFFTAITKPGYRTLEMDNGLTFKLKYDETQTLTSSQWFSSGPGVTAFTMDFIEDEPAISKSITIPTGEALLKGWYEIDGVDFADFGLIPDGEIGSILKYPAAKAPFTDGKKNYLDMLRLKHKEVTIPLCMKAKTKEAFMVNYQAFYNALAKPGKLKFYAKEIGATTYAYYTNCSSYSIGMEDEIEAKFEIKLVIPKVTWLDVSDVQMATVLKEVDLGLLAEENKNTITFNS